MQALGTASTGTCDFVTRLLVLVRIFLKFPGTPGADADIINTLAVEKQMRQALPPKINLPAAFVCRNNMAGT